METTATVDGYDFFYRQEGLRAFREAYEETYETVDYDQGGSLLRGDAAYGTPKIEAIRALALRAASLDPRWMLDLYRFKKDMRNTKVRLQTIPEAGHLAMIDQPHTVADAILDFNTEHRGLDALAQPYDGFPEVLGAQHVSEDFKGLWAST